MMLITTLIVLVCKDGGVSVNVNLWFLVVCVRCEVLCCTGLHSMTHTHTHTHTLSLCLSLSLSISVGLLCTSNGPVAETSAKQHTTLTRDRHPYPGWDSNPQSYQESFRRPVPYLWINYVARCDIYIIIGPILFLFSDGRICFQFLIGICLVG